MFRWVVLTVVVVYLGVATEGRTVRSVEDHNALDVAHEFAAVNHRIDALKEEVDHIHAEVDGIKAEMHHEEDHHAAVEDHHVEDAHHVEDHHHELHSAICIMHPFSEGVHGHVKFDQREGDEDAHVHIDFSDFDDHHGLEHHVNIHEYGDLSSGCGSNLGDQFEHADLGYVKTDEHGHHAVSDQDTHDLTLFGSHSVIGRSLVVYKVDGVTPISCCVIGHSKPGSHPGEEHHEDAAHHEDADPHEDADHHEVAVHHEDDDHHEDAAHHEDDEHHEDDDHKQIIWGIKRPFSL